MIISNECLIEDKLRFQNKERLGSDELLTYNVLNIIFWIVHLALLFQVTVRVQKT